jgi:hypothetical protein
MNLLPCVAKLISTSNPLIIASCDILHQETSVIMHVYQWTSVFHKSLYHSYINQLLQKLHHSLLFLSFKSHAPSLFFFSNFSLLYSFTFFLLSLTFNNLFSALQLFTAIYFLLICYIIILTNFFSGCISEKQLV